MKADVFIEGWRRRLNRIRAPAQAERIEYFSDSVTLRSCARFSGTVLAQRKGRTRNQWEHALTLARARASEDCPLISSSCCRPELTPAHAWNIEYLRSQRLRRSEGTIGVGIDYFPRKFATVVVNAPAISARRYYRAHFAAAR
jgi:hypothetical protein